MSVKQFESEWDAELLCVSLRCKLFAYAPINMYVRVQSVNGLVCGTFIATFNYIVVVCA